MIAAKFFFTFAILLAASLFIVKISPDDLPDFIAAPIGALILISSIGLIASGIWVVWS